MRVTVCEMSHEEDDFVRNWEGLVDHVKTQKSDLVLLPEMAFYRWIPLKRPFDSAVWQAAVASHDVWESRFRELAPALVLGTRPVNRKGKRMNEAFVWGAEEGVRVAHKKFYIPDEEGFWEASWYERGNGVFTPSRIRGVMIGFAICTDIWFFQHSRNYGKQGVHLIAHHRATQRVNLDKWLVAGRAAAVVSGAFCLSSNHVNPRGQEPSLGGMGWIVEPDGDVLGLTSQEEPFVTREINLQDVDRAKKTYPRYVLE